MIGVNECMRQTANRSDGLLRRDAPAGEAQRDMGVMERKNRIKMNGWETNKHHREKGKEGMGCSRSMFPSLLRPEACGRSLGLDLEPALGWVQAPGGPAGDGQRLRYLRSPS
ncbi:unnamed protein product [Leuciscus chuanchicus]